MIHSEIRTFLLISIFSTLQIWGFRQKAFLLVFLSVRPLDPDPGNQNVADPTDKRELIKQINNEEK